MNYKIIWGGYRVLCNPSARVDKAEDYKLEAKVGENKAIKALATKPDNLSWSWVSHDVMEEGIHFCRFFSALHTSAEGECACPHSIIHKLIKNTRLQGVVVHTFNSST